MPNNLLLLTLMFVILPRAQILPRGERYVYSTTILVVASRNQ